MGMGVRVFLSLHSGNQKMESEQSLVCRVLDSRTLPYTVVDVSAPGNQGLRGFMRSSARRQDGQRHPLPPQIFNGEQYRGDFRDFDMANEDDELEEFLGLERRVPKAAPVKTGAVAPPVGARQVGRLPREQGEGGGSSEGRRQSFAVEADCCVPCHQVEELGGERGEVEVTETPNPLDWKDLKVSTVKISFARFVEQEREEESEDDSESEEEEEEYMEDGEVQRKGSKGFKLLNNCKRFWKATQMMGQP